MHSAWLFWWGQFYIIIYYGSDCISKTLQVILLIILKISIQRSHFVEKSFIYSSDQDRTIYLGYCHPSTRPQEAQSASTFSWAESYSLSDNFMLNDVLRRKM